MFSYLFTAVFLYLMIDSQTNPQQNRIYWLIPLQLLWVNIHLFFIIGLGLTAGFLFEKIIIDRQQNQLLIKKLFLLLTGLVPVCFINPNGINGALYPFRIFSNYGMNVIENQSIHEYLIANPLKDNLGIIFFLLSIITLGVSFILNLKRKPIFYFLGSLATAIAGFLIIRTLAFFGYIFLISAPVNLNSVFSRYVISLRKNPGLYKNVHRNFIRILIVLLFFLILSVFLGKIPGFNKPALGLADWSQDPAKFFVEQKLKGPIFNDYDTGSYLIYYLFPGEKVFVDNRPEAYSQSFFKNTYLPIFVDENAWQKALKKYQFNVIILNQYSNGVGVTDFKYRRFNDPDWALVFANPQAAIFLRNTEENKKIIDKFRLTPDNIEQRIGYLIKSKNYEDQVDAADILNLVGRPDLGNKQFFRLVTRYPDKSRVWLALGQWEFNRSNKLNSLLAIMYLEKAIATGQTTADAYTYLGAAYIEVSEFDKARLMLKKALQIDSSHLDAKNLLEKIRAK
jgi:tetratricopeptide (TPR) repeat protein